MKPHHWMLALAALVAGCASTAPEPVHTTALRRICELPDVRTAGTLEVLDHTTTALVDLAALEFSFNPDAVTREEVASLTAAEESLRHDLRSDPIVVPHTSCSWRLIRQREHYSETLRIELSSVIPAGVARNTTPGIFARISAGGRPGAAWYWLPVTGDDAKRVGRPVRLEVEDG